LIISRSDRPVQVRTGRHSDHRVSMPDVASIADFLAALQRGDLVSPVEAEDAARGATDPATVALRLVAAGQLTQFQVRQLLSGRGDDLAVGPYVLIDR